RLGRGLGLGRLLVDLLGHVEELLQRLDRRLDFGERLDHGLALPLELLERNVGRLDEVARLLLQLRPLLQQLCQSLVHHRLPLSGQWSSSASRARSRRWTSSRLAACALSRNSWIASCADRKPTEVSRYAGSVTMEIS